MRSGRLLGLTLIGLAACTPVDPSGEMFAPVEPVSRPAASRATETVADKPAEGFDFDAQARDDEADAAGATGEVPLDRQLAGLGLAPADAEAPSPPPTLPMAPAGAVTTQAPAQPQGPWLSANSLTAGFGVRIIATLPQVQPPRAVVSLADGTEHVVRAGTLLPSADLVVLAIGADAVQVAEVRAGGDQAAIETRILPALYGR